MGPVIATTLLRQELVMKCEGAFIKDIKYSLPCFLKLGPSFPEVINILTVINSNDWSNPSVPKG